MNKSKVTKWTCDVCKVATFDSFEAAAKHEDLCRKKLITVWTCDICKERDFTSLEDATAHEKICAQQRVEKKKRLEAEKKRQILSQQRKQQQLQQQQQQQNQAAVYVCDICKDAVFHSVEEAKRHEESCSKRRRDGVADRKGNLNITVCKPAKYHSTDISTKSTIYNNIKEVTNVNELPNIRSKLQEKAKTGTVIAPQRSEQSKPVTSTVPRPTTKDSTVYIDTLPESPPKAKDKVVPQTTGFSNATSMSLKPSPIQNASKSKVHDSLPSASKPPGSSIVTGRNNESAIVLDEDDKDAVNTISPQEVTKNLSFTTIPERKEVFIPILQPICNNDANDIKMFSRLASVHRCILASLDLCEVQVVDRTKSEVSCNWITFRCTHCKYRFDKEWTKRSMGLELPLNVYAHLVRNCPSVPDEAKDVMKMTNPVIPADRDGKIEFRDFTENFCSQLGLVNALVSKNGEEAKKRLILPTSSPLRAQNANLEPTQRNDQVRTVSANSSANSVTNSTADSEVSPRATTKLPQSRNKRRIPVTSPMFPLVLQDDDAIYKQLSPFNMAAVTEIMFTIDDHDDMIHSPPGYKRILLRCKHCGNPSRVGGLDAWHKTVYAMSYSHLSKTCHFIPPSKREKIVEGKKKIGGSGNTYIGLKQYCEYVSQRYNFTDGKPGILVKYNGPSYDEVNGSHQTRKRPRSQANTDSANDTYLSKHKYLSLFSNSQTNITVKNPNDFNEKNRTSDLIPRGAIPLVFSLTKEKSSKLNAMNKIIVDNFELCEQIKPIDQASQTDLRLALRCQNCNYKPIPFVRQLSGINSWYLDLIECSSHLKDCPCTQESVKRSLVKARQKNDEGEVSLKEYCDFLVELYGFADRESNGDECVGVKWGECKYVVENYSSKPEKIRSRNESEIIGSNQYPIRRVPQHSLMLSPDSNSTEHQMKENLGLTEVPLTPVIRPYILSDFNYLLVGQLEFVIIAPKVLAKKRSSRNSMSSLSTNNDNSKEQFVHLGAKCRHCRHTKRISTIANFTNDRKYEEFIHHFHHCRGTPDDIRFHLNEFRAQHEIQKNWGGVASIQEYLRKIMIDTYRVEDAKEDGVANIILRNEYMQNAKDVCNEINRRDADDDQMLRLPLLIPKMLEPVSMDTKKIAFMKSVVNEMKDSDSGNEGMDEFSDENDSDKQDAIEKSDNGNSEVEVSDVDKMSIEKDDPQDDDMDSAKNSQQAGAEDTSIASVESSSSSDDDWV